MHRSVGIAGLAVVLVALALLGRAMLGPPPPTPNPPGSSGWVRVVVTPGGASPSFAFESRVVPWWKHWLRSRARRNVPRYDGRRIERSAAGAAVLRRRHRQR